MAGKRKIFERVRKIVNHAMRRDYDKKTEVLTITFPCGCYIEVRKGEREGRTSMSWMDIDIDFDDIYYCDNHQPATYQTLFEKIAEGEHRWACPKDATCNCAQEFAYEGLNLTIPEEDKYELKAS